MIFPDSVALASYCDPKKQSALEETKRIIQEEGRCAARELSFLKDGERGVQFLRDHDGNELPFLADNRIRKGFEDKTFGKKAEKYLVPNIETIELESVRFPETEEERQKLLKNIDKRFQERNSMAREHTITSLNKRDDYLREVCTRQGIPGKLCASGIPWKIYEKHRNAGHLDLLYNPQNKFGTKHRFLSATDHNDKTLRRSNV